MLANKHRQTNTSSQKEELKVRFDEQSQRLGRWKVPSLSPPRQKKKAGAVAVVILNTYIEGIQQIKQSSSTQTGRGKGEGRLDMKVATKGGPHQSSFCERGRKSLPVVHFVGKYL